MMSKAWLWCEAENYLIILPLYALVSILCFVLLIKKTRKYNAPLPPGPRGLPFIGNLPFLERDLHSYFGKLAEKYGPIIKVRLGSKLIIVLSSPSVAKEIYKDHDTTFANRGKSAMGVAISYGGNDMGMAPYGEIWRMLRRLCVKELINQGTLEALYGLRRREVRHMVNQIHSKIGSPIGLNEVTLQTLFSMVTSMMWGSTLEAEERNRVTAEFRHVAEEMMKLFGAINISDVFPVLTPFDLQGMERKMKENVTWFGKIVDRVIDQRHEIETKGDKGKEANDFLQILLQLIDQADEKTPLTVTHLKGLFLDIVLGGTKTTSTTLEWAMTELMIHPEIMEKLKQELDEVVGMNNVVEESDLPKLQYLDAVVKEVLRLHPPGPLLLPRSPSESCVIGGYTIPKGATVFVNAWAIQRNPDYWEDPLEFRPERFLNTTLTFTGNDLRYLPFGSGKRICVGIPIANRQVSYLLASLLHSFDWELPEGVKLDMSEVFGVELTKKIPLVAIPKPRLFDPELYS